MYRQEHFREALISFVLDEFEYKSILRKKIKTPGGLERYVYSDYRFRTHDLLTGRKDSYLCYEPLENPQYVTRDSSLAEIYSGWIGYDYFRILRSQSNTQHFGPLIGNRDDPRSDRFNGYYFGESGGAFRYHITTFADYLDNSFPFQFRWDGEMLERWVEIHNMLWERKDMRVDLDLDFDDPTLEQAAEALARAYAP